jgi:hypothetical protein
MVGKQHSEEEPGNFFDIENLPLKMFLAYIPRRGFYGQL